VIRNRDGVLAGGTEPGGEVTMEDGVDLDWSTFIPPVSNGWAAFRVLLAPAFSLSRGVSAVVSTKFRLCNEGVGSVQERQVSAVIIVGGGEQILLPMVKTSLFWRHRMTYLASGDSPWNSAFGVSSMLNHSSSRQSIQRKRRTEVSTPHQVLRSSVLKYDTVIEGLLLANKVSPTNAY